MIIHLGDTCPEKEPDGMVMVSSLLCLMAATSSRMICSWRRRQVGGILDQDREYSYGKKCSFNMLIDDFNDNLPW